MEIPKQIKVGRTKYTVLTPMYAINRHHYGGINYESARIYVFKR